MTFAEATILYDINLTTIQKWKKRLHSKAIRNVVPRKILDDALRKDVKDHSNDYHYDRAGRFNCTAPEIFEALKRL
jgi:hypothetical protein